jgi:endonuclease YncB( thermonuclease family)
MIYGKVARVIDGDTIRVRHCPTPRTCPEPEKGEGLAESTLKIRIYGVDTPELQKKKSDPPSQPYAQEGKDFLSSLILDKTVEIRLLSKDQYNRAISEVETGSVDVSLALLQRGLATMYTGKGAQYDGKRELMKATQEQAKMTKRGMWSQGDRMVSPAIYKREQRQLLQQQGAQVAARAVPY